MINPQTNPGTPQKGTSLIDLKRRYTNLMISRAIFYCLVLFPFCTFSQVFPGLVDTETGMGPSFKSFNAPNEPHPEEAKVLYEKVPKGIHVSVGSERSFIGAALNKNATSLLCIDKHPATVLYNRINTALLEIATSREDYLNLRLYSSPERWAARALQRSQNEGINPESYRVLVDEENQTWWTDNVRDDKDFSDFHRTQGASKGTFVGSNYLFDDALFERLSKMAKERRIQSVVGDLRDKAFLETLQKEILASNSRISVFDLSNAWWKSYIPKDDFEYFIQKLHPLGDPDSVLVMTVGVKHYWNYLGLSFSHLSPANAASHAIQHQPEFLAKRRAVLDDEKLLIAIKHGCKRFFQ